MDPITLSSIKEFSSTDVLCHYTKMSSAIEYILHEGKLRLSPRHETSDVFEKINRDYGYSRSYPANHKRDLNKEKIDNNKFDHIVEQCRSFEKSIRQVCFCMNNMTASENELDRYSFFKPRMWDQYGDGYKGCTLLFSKRSLLSEPTFEFSISGSEITYENSTAYLNSHISLSNIFENEITADDGADIAINLLKKALDKKHIDYKGEREYRIWCNSSNPHEFLDIHNSLIGIAYMGLDEVSDFNKNALVEYGKKFDIPVLHIFPEGGASITRLVKGFWYFPK